jgi:hypothetical protein
MLAPDQRGACQRAIDQGEDDHSSTLKTLQEIFGVRPLLPAAASPATRDLSDFFLAE